MTNKKCQQCVALCKQSYQVKIISCPNFRSSQAGTPYTGENATTVVLVPIKTPIEENVGYPTTK